MGYYIYNKRLTILDRVTMKKAMLTDFAGYCAGCKKQIRSKLLKGGYVEYYEYKGRKYCLNCGRTK